MKLCIYSDGKPYIYMYQTPKKVFLKLNIIQDKNL